MCYSWCFVHSIRNNFRIQHTSRHNQRDLSLYKQSRWGTTQQQVLRPVRTWHHMVCQYYNQSRCSFPSRQSHIWPTSTYSLLLHVYLSDCVAVTKHWLSCTKVDGSPERETVIQFMTWISAADPHVFTSVFIAPCTCRHFWLSLSTYYKKSDRFYTESTLFWQIGYCTFMYGVTGNYLLHVLWIILITFALLLTGVYLRKYWLDIKGRYVYAYYVLHSLI